MKIKLEDVFRWRDETFRVSEGLRLDKIILGCLQRETEFIVVPGYQRNAGVVNFSPARIFVHEQTEGTRCLEGYKRDIFHQSETDRLLIGELYNFFADLPNNFDSAREAQIQFAEYRANENNVFSREWKIKARKLSELPIPKPVRYKIA